MEDVVSVLGFGLSASVQSRICASASLFPTRGSLSRTSSTRAITAARSTGIRRSGITTNVTGITGSGNLLYSDVRIVTSTRFIPDDGRELLLLTQLSRLQS